MTIRVFFSVGVWASLGKCVEKVVREVLKNFIDTDTMAQKLYVGGLPYSTTDQELADAFAQAGAVASATIVTDRMTGRSRGFGFVEMTNDGDAQPAIDMWHGKEFGGRMLTVNLARPKEDRPAGDRPSRGPRREWSGGGQSDRGGRGDWQQG